MEPEQKGRLIFPDIFIEVVDEAIHLLNSLNLDSQVLGQGKEGSIPSTQAPHQDKGAACGGAHHRLSGRRAARVRGRRYFCGIIV